MIIRRAPHLGAHAKVCQAANDWILVDLLDGADAGKRKVIVSPAAVELEDGEIDLFHRHAGGFFWDMWEYDMNTCRFKPKGGEPPASPRRRKAPRHWGRR